MTWNSHPPVHVYVQQGKVKAVISKIKYLIELRVIPLTLTTLTRSSSLVGYYVWKGFPPDEYQFKTVIIVAARAASKVIFLPSSLYFKAPRAPEWVIPCEFNRPGGVCIYRCTSQFILLSCSWWLIFRRAHLKESRRWKTFIPCVLDFSSVLYQEPAAGTAGPHIQHATPWGTFVTSVIVSTPVLTAYETMYHLHKLQSKSMSFATIKIALAKRLQLTGLYCICLWNKGMKQPNSRIKCWHQTILNIPDM